MVIALPFQVGADLVDALDFFELPHASPSKVGCFPGAVQRIFAIYFRQSETSFLIFVLIHSKAERINFSISFMLHLPFDYLCFTSVFVSWGLCSDLNFRYRSHCSRRNSVSVALGCVEFCLSSAVQIPSIRCARSDFSSEFLFPQLDYLLKRCGKLSMNGQEKRAKPNSGYRQDVISHIPSLPRCPSNCVQAVQGIRPERIPAWQVARAFRWRARPQAESGSADSQPVGRPRAGDRG
jgi:hypothetical protein